MTADFSLLLLAGVLSGVGAFLLLERTIIRILLGVMLLSNGVNLLVLAAGGPPGSPPILRRFTDNRPADADALAQGMILTSIVITAGITAFVLALAYRSYRFTLADDVPDDAEDSRIAKRSHLDAASAPDRDRSDDPVTGEPTAAGDTVDYDDGDDPTDDSGGDSNGDDAADDGSSDDGVELPDGAPEPGGEDPR